MLVSRHQIHHLLPSLVASVLPLDCVCVSPPPRLRWRQSSPQTALASVLPLDCAGVSSPPRLIAGGIYALVAIPRDYPRLTHCELPAIFPITYIPILSKLSCDSRCHPSLSQSVLAYSESILINILVLIRLSNYVYLSETQKNFLKVRAFNNNYLLFIIIHVICHAILGTRKV